MNLLLDCSFISYLCHKDPAIANQFPPGQYGALDEGNRLDVWTKGPDGVTPEQGEVGAGSSLKC